MRSGLLGWPHGPFFCTLVLCLCGHLGDRWVHREDPVYALLCLVKPQARAVRAILRVQGRGLRCAHTAQDSADPGW